MVTNGLKGYCAAALIALCSACSLLPSFNKSPASNPQAQANAGCARTVRAEVVAMEQAYLLNRYGAFNPAGMLYALKSDVVSTDSDASLRPGKVKLRDDKRPRPLVLRVNEGDCLEVRLHNMLMPSPVAERLDGPEEYGGKVPGHMKDPDGTVYSPQAGVKARELVKATAISADMPWTRAVSFHPNGLEYAAISPEQCPPSSGTQQWVCGSAASNVGLNEGIVHPSTPVALAEKLKTQGSQIYPGQSAMYRYHGYREGTYFAYSTGAGVGGEGNGGQLGLGLFAAVNVQPAGARWYRSQISHSDMQAVTLPPSAQHPYSRINYEALRADGTPILNMLRGDEIVHSDVNAVVTLPDTPLASGETAEKCKGYVHGNSCGRSYREFTVIMHDEVKAVQAFAELEDENNPLHYVKDGMGINYGVGGMGAMVVARQRKTGPVKNCPECRAEEFFLSSWANGDPALILKYDTAGKKPVGAMYPDDPSNVHHSYLGDPVRFRNIHAGPKETHVFHLHAHQWVLDASDPNSTYLDSQTISPGATFSYEIEYGGSGNRNYSPGDSIFHCHLYPHFAQGMWELWRVHDVFENGKPGRYDASKTTVANGNHWQMRNLPDAEVENGIETPALVPIPGTALAPMPTQDFRGYPFYIPGKEGHRPPQPPLDMDKLANGELIDGGMPRHVILDGSVKTGAPVFKDALKKGGEAAQLVASRVYQLNPKSLELLAEEWDTLSVQLLKHEGQPDEQKAMNFHEGKSPEQQAFKLAAHPTQPWRGTTTAYQTEWANTVAGQASSPTGTALFFVNGRGRKPGAPYGNPCPATAPMRQYKAAFLQTELTVNRHGWFDPQARMMALEQDVKDIIDSSNRDRLPEPLFFRANSGDCIEYASTNLVPSALNVDDFQIYTPTDTIGQHIHLVKFDVTSSDGSGNGWNYEDATFSPDEVRERVFATNKALRAAGRPASELLTLKEHPLFKQLNCAALPRGTDDEKRAFARCDSFAKKGHCPANWEAVGLAKLGEEHPYCGAQRTMQRWWADPQINEKTGKDNTLRTVFTHDHMGPSSHQQHGLYAALVVEPTNSVWLNLGQNALNWPKLAAKDPTEIAKVLGGADFNQPVPASRIVANGGRGEREPLKLRDDGGPTSSRANIVAPKCIGDTQSNPLHTTATLAQLACSNGETEDTRREFAVAFADFAILYNAALEPINPEIRDLSALRFGRRQVPITAPRPLAISSEDPGTQLINYRNEPIGLRIAERSLTPENKSLGGFDYKQKLCDKPNDGKPETEQQMRDRLHCTGDMANVFSTHVHADRDKGIALDTQKVDVSQATKSLLTKAGLGDQLTKTLAKIENWRKQFNCALYPEDVLKQKCLIANEEPWRQLGDPATPILPAYEGDPVQIRLVQGAQEAQHVFTMNGAKWLRQPASPNSGYISAQPLGISEHFEFNVNVSPFTEMLRNDYLYFGSSMDQLWDGMWGVMRSYGHRYPSGAPGVAKLNALRATPVAQPSDQAFVEDDALKVCDKGKDQLSFDVSAVRACQLFDACNGQAGLGQKGILFNQRLTIEDPNAIVFVQATNTQMIASNTATLAELKDQFKTGKRTLEPLIMRAPAGACVRVQLRNHLPLTIADGPNLKDQQGARIDGHYGHNLMSMILDGFNYNQIRMSSSVGLSAPMVAQAPIRGDGSNVGINGLTANLDETNQGTLLPAGPEAITQYYWYAGDYTLNKAGKAVSTPIEFGALPLRSLGDVIKHPAHGAIGALVIGPKDSQVCPAKGSAGEQAADARSAVSASICNQKGDFLYRDFVMVLQDAVDATMAKWPIPNLKGAEEPDDYGVKAINYRTDPIWGRRGQDPSMDFGERNKFDYANVLSSKLVKSADSKTICQAGIKPLAAPFKPCDPETPIFVAQAGREVRVRVVHPGGHTRQQAISVYGHHWEPFPWSNDSKTMLTAQEALNRGWTVQGSFNGVGPMMSANLVFKAGGKNEISMDYLFRSEASFLFDGGLWGLLRVEPKP